MAQVVFTVTRDLPLPADAVFDELVESVVCRWCGSGDRIEIVARPEFGGPGDEGPGDGGP